MADKLGAKVAGFTILGLVLLVAVAWTVLYLWSGDRAPRSAAVEGVEIAGLSPAQAESRLRSALADRARHRSWSATATAGRGASPRPRLGSPSTTPPRSRRPTAARGWSRRNWALVTGGGDHHAEVAVDQSRMQATLDELGSGIGRRPVEGRSSSARGRPSPCWAGRAPSSLAAPHRRCSRGASCTAGPRRCRPRRASPRSRTGRARAMKEFAGPAMSGPVTLVLAGQRVVAPPALFGKGLSLDAEGRRAGPARGR